MTEYIEREATIYEIEHDAPGQVRYSREDAADCVRYMLAADVEPVRHGRWIDKGTYELCSVCQQAHRKEIETYYKNAIQSHMKMNYCPNCGAKMDRGESDV